MKIHKMLLASLLLLSPGPVFAHMFLNSAEPICNGSDPTILMCDDYEDGSWFITNADSGGSGDPQNDGWAGTIWATDPLQQNYTRCGGKGAAGTNCTATTSNRSTSGKGARSSRPLDLFPPPVNPRYRPPEYSRPTR